MRRHYLLNPDESQMIQRIFVYLLACYALRFGVVVHAACIMSTHYHLVFTDVRGERKNFLEQFDRILANCVKAYRKWPDEAFCKPTKIIGHRLHGPRAILQAMAYAMANPVQAFCVRYASQWPGFNIMPSEVGDRFKAKRPPMYLDQENPMWEEKLELPTAMPECLIDLYGSEARQRVAQELRELERRAWDEAAKKGIRFLGAHRVVKRSCYKRAKSYELFGERNPIYAAGGDPVAAAEALERHRTFQREYRHELKQLRAGEEDVIFPFGTVRLRIDYGVRCHPPPCTD